MSFLLYAQTVFLILKFIRYLYSVRNQLLRVHSAPLSLPVSFFVTPIFSPFQHFIVCCFQCSASIQTSIRINLAFVWRQRERERDKAREIAISLSQCNERHIFCGAERPTELSCAINNWRFPTDGMVHNRIAEYVGVCFRRKRLIFLTKNWNELHWQCTIF